MYPRLSRPGILAARAQGYEQFRTNLSGRAEDDRQLAVIYAGGDDLFILGHWLDVFRTREAEYVRRAIPRAAAETGLDDALIGEYFHLIRRCFDEIDLAGQARFLHKLKSDRRLTVPAADLKRCA